METTWRVQPKDRDEAGKIIVEPRPLADLLPKAEAPIQPAQPPALKLTKAEIAGMAMVGLLAAFVIVYAWGTPAEPASAPPAIPTAAAIATAIPTAAPVATPVPTIRPIAAYWAPGGEHAPDMANRGEPIARYGETWVQVQDGRWIAAGDADLDNTALMDLPDRAPPTPAPRVIVVAPPPPPPDPCLTAGTAAQTVTVCGQGDLQTLARDKWIATYGGNAGELGSPSPQPTR
jgi:hypothetical protein